MQALWREDRGLATGRHVNRREPHCPRFLDSCISTAGPPRRSFLHPGIVPVVTRGLAIREPGAAYAVDQLRIDLLSSQPMAFNQFGLLAHDPKLPIHFVAELSPGTLTAIHDSLFEHSPGCTPHASQPTAYFKEDRF